MTTKYLHVNALGVIEAITFPGESTAVRYGTIVEVPADLSVGVGEKSPSEAFLRGLTATAPKEPEAPVVEVIEKTTKTTKAKVEKTE